MYNPMYFTLFFTQIVNLVNANGIRVSDLESYQHYPIIYNVDEDCLPQTSQPANLPTCLAKAWLVSNGVQLINQTGEFRRKSDIHDCFKLCLDSTNCVAIQRTRHGDTSYCWIFNKHHGTIRDIGSLSFISYFLKCCELKRKETSNLNQQNYPVVFLNDSLTIQQEIFDKKKCNNFAWQLKELHDVDASYFYKSFSLKNTIDCMTECLKDKECTAIKTQVDEFDPTCFFYKGSSPKIINAQDLPHKNVYLLHCAKVNEKILKENVSSELLMLYEPTKVCKTVTTNVGTCVGKIWHVEDGVRMVGHFKIVDLHLVKNCLDLCTHNEGCYTISIDWILFRCLFFKEHQFSKHYQQFHWTSYTLKCCDEFVKETNNAELTSSANNYINNSSSKELMLLLMLLIYFYWGIGNFLHVNHAITLNIDNDC